MRRTCCRLLVFSAGAWLLCSIGQAANIPPDFQETVLFDSEEIDRPTAIEWGPDGALWIATTRGGEVYVYENDTLKLTLDVYATFPGIQEQGLHNIAIDPDYLTNQHVWVYYNVFPTKGPTLDRLSRFTRVGDALQNEQVILDRVAEGTIHNGGCLAFAADKTLFVGSGDDNLGSTTAQDPFDVRGKLLRIQRDGSHAPDNPFADGVAADPRVWALGLRNPFRCSLQPDGSGNLFINDVGGCCWEEINIGLPGANYGHAALQNPQPEGNTGVTYPIYAFPHTASGGAIVGGDHVEPGEFAPQYEGDYFFGDYSNGQIWRLVPAQNRWKGPLWAAVPPAYVDAGFTELWADEVDNLVDLEFGPDGALYYVAWVPSGLPEPLPAIGRIAYVPGLNRQPEAVAIATPSNGAAPLMTTLDGSGSSDPDDDPLSYNWNLGDGNLASGQIVAHTYAQGVWEAVLTVSDGVHPPISSPPIRIASGNAAPSPTLSTPTAGTTFDAGQVIGYSGSATDDVPIICDWLTWQVLLHDSQSTQVFAGPIRGGCSGSFTTADVGNPSPDVSYEVVLVANDVGGPLGQPGALAGTATVEIHPNTSEITLETTPLPDLALELDSVEVTAPLTVEGVVNFKRTIGAVDGQPHGNGHTYRWLSWSDAGAIEHEIQTPPVDTTYTADFGCDVLVEVEQLLLDKETGDEISFEWSPISDICLSTGADRYSIYSAAVAVPSIPPGSFPDDPAWTFVDSSGTESFSYSPGPGESYFLVVGKGTDGLDGPVGHYGF